MSLEPINTPETPTKAKLWILELAMSVISKSNNIGNVSFTLLI